MSARIPKLDAEGEKDPPPRAALRIQDTRGTCKREAFNGRKTPRDHTVAVQEVEQTGEWTYTKTGQSMVERS
jgi:hypothetical protein